ncbi:hypothetical protein OF83DRAFT_1068362 [Amylostereum chailletii]|nr:hypothetical protein OF83DRAFT_1068362 [Amylostereum chailletii]
MSATYTPEEFSQTVKEEEIRLRSLHPTTDDIPSCMSLFDDFLTCNMLSSQFKSLYRHGEMARCAGRFHAFKFCMSNNRLHPEQKRDEWIHHRAEWWARRRLGASSENVWEIRREPLKDFPPRDTGAVYDDGTLVD